MQIGVAEVSTRLGVSARRVRAMVERGDLPARSISGRWVIDEAELVGRGVRRVARPMSPRVATALLDLLSGKESSGLSPSEAWRLRGRRDQLFTDPAPAPLLRAWLRARPRPLLLAAASTDLRDLAADPRVVASGISDQRAGILAMDQLEGWIAQHDLDEVRQEFLLVESDAPNVVLHVADEAVSDPVPLGWSIADLAQHRGPREEAEVARLLQVARESR